jgi:Zn-dependent metalloprotease
MTYGDGSRPATATTTSCKGFPPMVTLDITAHEMAHGVTEHTSGLVYQHSYGGINEGLSGGLGWAGLAFRLGLGVLGWLSCATKIGHKRK